MVSADVGIVAGADARGRARACSAWRATRSSTRCSRCSCSAARRCSRSRRSRDRPRLQWPGYVFLALAVLTKGPIALVFCGLTLAVAIAAVRRSAPASARTALGARARSSSSRLVGAVVRLHVSAASARPSSTATSSTRTSGCSRAAGSRNQPGFWFYFQILAAGLAAVDRAADRTPGRRRARRGHAASGSTAFETLLWAWTLAVVGFFTLSTFKLDHYVFPAAPALCLLCARAWADVRAEPLAPRHAARASGLHLIGPFLVAVGLGCGYFLIARLALPWGAVMVPIALTRGRRVRHGTDQRRAVRFRRECRGSARPRCWRPMSA